MKTTGVVAFILAAAAPFAAALPAPVHNGGPEVSGFKPPFFNYTRPWDQKQPARLPEQGSSEFANKGSDRGSWPAPPPVVPTGIPTTAPVVTPTPT
ncbi:hypothetical protein FDECE_9960, partial [Fusarium decemcellulare]